MNAEDCGLDAEIKKYNMVIIKKILIVSSVGLFLLDLFLIPGALFLLVDVYSPDQIMTIRFLTVLLMLVVIVLMLFADSIKENK